MPEPEDCTNPQLCIAFTSGPDPMGWPELLSGKPNQLLLHKGSLSLETDRAIMFEGEGKIESAGGLNVKTGGATSFTGGKVGIGNTDPQAELQIKDLTTIDQGNGWANIGSNAYYDGDWKRVNEARPGASIHLNGNDDAGQEFRFARVEADGSPRDIAVIGSKTSLFREGMVGIGVDDPGYVLDVAERIRLRQGSSPSAGVWFSQTAAGERAFVGMANDNEVGFWGQPWAGWGLRMNVDSGNVGIGTDPSGHKLDVGGTTRTQKLQLGDRWLMSGIGDAHGNDSWLRLFNINGADYYGGFAAGQFWCINGQFSGSDLRMKQAISPLDCPLEAIQALRSVRFKWRDRGNDQPYRIGLIAQEVEEVFPELVGTGPDEMKGVDYAGLTAVLLEAVKQQQAEIAALRSEVRELAERLQAGCEGNA